MSESYPRRDQARGLWKINDITKNIKSDGTYPNSNTGAVRAIWMGGGAPGVQTTIDYFQTSTAGNAVDFGDLSVARDLNAGGGSFTRGLCCAGNPGSSPYVTNTIDYIHFASTGNAADFGDVTAARSYLAGMSNNIRCLSVDGLTPSRVNTIDTVNIATLGNATDFGDSQTATALPTCTANPTRGIKAGGNTPSNIDTIDFYELSTTGNGVDFGNLAAAQRSQSSFGSQTRCVFAGGQDSSTREKIETIQFGSLGNAVDYGDALSGTTENGRGTSNSILGLFAKGSVSNVIEQKTIASANNASDFGDLTQARTAAHATSNGHGGLQAFSQRAPELYSPTGKVVSGGLGVGDIGLFQGGEYGYSSVIDYIQISSTGNGVKFGDLNGQISVMGGTGSSTRFLAGGGQPGFSTQIQYGAFSTKGNTADYGDLTTGRDLLSALGNETRGVWGGGRINPSNDASNVMDYITISTLGNATDFGDLTVARGNIGGNVNSSTRGIFHGGYAGADSNVIDYITIGSTGNATDFGDLTRARQNPGGFSSTVRGVMGGGFNPGTSPGTSTDIIDYITIASTGNATDFGDLAFSTSYADGVSNNTRGVFSGLNNPSAPGADGTFGNAPQILYVTIASTGNTTLFGELTARRYGTAPASNGHGGLS